MYKDYRYINAGTNEYYRWGKECRRRLESCLVANEKGFYSIPADGGSYWTFGTSEGKYGEFAKYGDTLFSVNSLGCIWAKEGTDKAVKFVEMIKSLLSQMDKDHPALAEDYE